MKEPLKKITPEFMGDVSRYPEFLASVRDARERPESPPHVAVSLGAFSDDPFGLYACLWHAWSEGVRVTFLAPDESETD